MGARLGEVDQPPTRRQPLEISQPEREAVNAIVGGKAVLWHFFYFCCYLRPSLVAADSFCTPSGQALFFPVLKSCGCPCLL